MHAAAGEAQRAVELEQTVLARLAAVCGAESSWLERLEPGAALRGRAERPQPDMSPGSRDVER